MASVKIALDNLPEDATVEVPYLGEFNNNTTTEVDDDRWNVFLFHLQSEEQANAYREADELVISSERAQQITEQLNEIQTAVEDENLDEYKKAQLQEMASRLNVAGFEDMKKDELVEAIRSRSVAQPAPGQHDANEEGN